MDAGSELEQRISRKTARTAVVGLGYVGLPLAVLYAQAGFGVVGIERNPDRVAQINQGKSYIEGVPDEELALAVRERRLSATSELSPILEADVVAICVPTPLDKNRQPDISYIEGVVRQAKAYWHPGQLVLLESTTYPGTTDELLVPGLEATGLQVGRDIFAAFSPERIDPGNKSFHVGNVPKVVGGATDRCTEITRCFYEQVLRAPVVPVSSPKVAEMTKALRERVSGGQRLTGK